jgi:radical SAM protein with 4Fe4S-binding SPASM domain
MFWKRVSFEYSRAKERQAGSTCASTLVFQFVENFSLWRGQSEKLWEVMMPSIFLRSEPFGGVIADSTNERLFFVDKFSFEVVRSFAKGIGKEHIKKVATSKFPKSDHETAFSRIDAIDRFINEQDRSSSTIRLCSGDVGDKIPTLSAPLDIYWEITRRCNETCIHCYNNSSPSGFNPSIDHINKIIDELASYALRNITLTGGEPMMRRDFWQIVDRLRPLTYELTMGTNGTLINDGNVQQVAEKFDILNISLDDPSQPDFDKFRGYDGAFSRTMKALTLLSATDVQINIQTVLTRKSISRLDDLGALLKNLRVNNWVVRFAFESGRAKGGTEYLSGREIFEQSENLKRIKEKFETPECMVTIGSNYPWSYKEKYPYVPPNDDLQTCAAATTHAAIDAFGRMAPCSLFTETDYKTGSVFGRSFLETWRESNEFQSMRNLKRRDVKGCGTCANASGICGGGCRAKAYMMYDTILKNDYSCNYSH